MKTLILYSTKYGTSEECAHTLSKKLDGEVFIVNLKENKPANLSGFDKIIIGGSIYMGQVQPIIKKFCIDNISVLKSKPLGLYLSCMSEDENIIQTALDNAFSLELTAYATAKSAFGGAFHFSKMNFFDKTIMKMVTKKDAKEGKVTADSNVSEDKISAFADKINLV